jgi:CBS domain-containing protein
MSRDLLTVDAGVPIVAAVQQMAERNVGAVLVMEAGRLAGIMTERDLMRAFARGLRDDADQQRDPPRATSQPHGRGGADAARSAA